MIQQLYYGPVLCVFLSLESDFMAFSLSPRREGWWIRNKMKNVCNLQANLSVALGKIDELSVIFLGVLLYAKK